MTMSMVTARRRCFAWATAVAGTASTLLLFLLIPFVSIGISLSEENVVLANTHSHCDNGVENENQHCERPIAAECGVWIARSTIPGSGLGMFAGRTFEDNEELLESGDVVIPIVDFELFQYKYKYKSLWDSYTWDSETTLTADEGLYDVNAASPGFGSCANSYLDLHNVEEWRPSVDYLLDRTKDPGAGGFSAYYDRRSTAKGRIQAGDELFVSYGQEWFEARDNLGPVPLKGDHRKGQVILDKFERMQQQIDNASHILTEMWQRFVWDSPFYNESRLLNTLPASWDDMELAMNDGLLEMRKTKHRVTQQWLQDHGTCADNMLVATSTIPQAGRGAFATRFLPKGTVVAPVPLVHIPHKERFKLYKVDTTTKEVHGGNATTTKRSLVVKDKQTSTGMQLMTNYCFGHSNSTLLLCPYGVMTAAINHNQTLANLKVQWGDPNRTGHDSEWLDLPIMSLVKQQHSGLAMELVATRDIEPGEELFLDYGNEWEDAWQEHVKRWKPTAHDGPTARTLNEDMEAPLRTVFEQMDDPYPDTVKMKCESSFQHGKNKWRQRIGNHTSLMNYVKHEDMSWQDCDLLRRSETSTTNGTTFLYTAVLITKKGDGGSKIVGSKLSNVPREAFVFAYKPYQSDMHLPNAFRHEIMIPNDMFPLQWQNAVGHRKEGANQ